MKYKDLKNTTDEQLVELHDAEPTSIGRAYFLDEIRHRELMRALHSISGVVEHVASISLSADVAANYILAKWKRESYGAGGLEQPPNEYLDDHRIKVSKT